MRSHLLFLKSRSSCLKVDEKWGSCRNEHVAAIWTELTRHKGRFTVFALRACLPPAADWGLPSPSILQQRNTPCWAQQPLRAMYTHIQPIWMHAHATAHDLHSTAPHPSTADSGYRSVLVCSLNQSPAWVQQCCSMAPYLLTLVVLHHTTTCSTKAVAQPMLLQYRNTVDGGALTSVVWTTHQLLCISPNSPGSAVTLPLRISCSTPTPTP